MVSKISSTFLTNAQALALGTPQQVIEEANTDPTSLGFTTKVIHLADASFHEKRVEALAKHYIDKLENYLKEHPFRFIKDALEDPLIYKEIRSFLRNEGCHFQNHPLIKQCKRLHLAAKLGINLEVIEANEGFEAYAKQSLERYLVTYEDEIEVDENNQIWMKFKGESTIWSEIYEAKVERDSNPNNDRRFPWTYDREGVQWNKDFIHFDKLEPMFKKEDASEWDNIDVLEICACESVKSSLGAFTGVHAWLRIKTSEGEVYPLSIYRPEKPKNKNLAALKSAFSTKKAYFSYEFSEFWPLEKEDLHTIPIQITKEQREQILKQFMEDHNDPSKTFQLSQSNCLFYAVDLLKTIVGKTLPTDQSIYGTLNPKRFHWITHKVPLSVRKVAVAVGAVFANLLQVALGASVVDKNVTAKGVKPHISSIWDIFNPDKAIGHHPYTLMTKTLDWVNDWKARERKRLEAEIAEEGDNKAELEEELRLLEYQIPPESELPKYYV